ncbi:MAG: N-acetylmuramic acid 6-phosphate etherase [Verrucomicrobiota bacterium]
MSSRRSASATPTPARKSAARPGKSGGSAGSVQSAGGALPPGFYLGIEGGGTRTTALLADEKGAALMEAEFPPSNLHLLSDRELQWRLKEIAARLPVPVNALTAVAIGLAATRSEADRDRIRRAASRVFPKIPCYATDDLETALCTVPAAPGAAARVLVLSGTGSCCFGFAPDGRKAKVGGRGHIIGDRGSATDIGLRALKGLVAYADRSGKWPKLGTLILDALALNVPDDLIDWSMQAAKMDLAALAIPVFRAAALRDSLARRILEDAAEALAADANACAAKLASSSKTVQFVLNGGVLLKNPGFCRDVAKRLKTAFPAAVVVPLAKSSVWGAVALARQIPIAPPKSRAARNKKAAASVLDDGDSTVPAAPTGSVADGGSSGFEILTALRDSPTERRNPRSQHLDTMPLPEAVDLMLDEEGRVPAAIGQERASLVRVIEAVIHAFQNEGSLFYIGAGTSGRMGVLDASECPPTFRAPREQVQGIIAGGQRALWSAVEGAEDDAAAGADAIRHRNVGQNDVLVGIAASGRTPYVWGALAEAKARGAVTVILCFNPGIKKVLTQNPDAFQPDHVIAPDLGPEVLTGSTRLKAGTATKQVLNLLTTLAMSRSGKVVSNLMIDLNPSNVKLRDRAQRILNDLTGCGPEAAKAALEASGWVVKTAYEALKKK